MFREFYSIRLVRFRIIQKNVNLELTFWCKKRAYDSRPNFFIVPDSQMRFGTNYSDTLNLLSLGLLLGKNQKRKTYRKNHKGDLTKTYLKRTVNCMENILNGYNLVIARSILCNFILNYFLELETLIRQCKL